MVHDTKDYDKHTVIDDTKTRAAVSMLDMFKRIMAQPKTIQGWALNAVDGYLACCFFHFST